MAWTRYDRVKGPLAVCMPYVSFGMTHHKESIGALFNIATETNVNSQNHSSRYRPIVKMK